ncbi:hypothetical protein RhiJN_03900 [Ceratobasidium sp. AG-Ba]|nr:hypothetical protein RhiJN_03900 [Ceratobasidium sp. AG-Ba]QRW04793.1 hypothetical protein RhiLY_03792 [Ceratobasidium sp. AG-Ba]
MSSSVPPRYVIVSQTSLPPDENNNNRAANLIHPQIHYQYDDDPPTAIPMSLPSEAEIVYLDFNPNDPALTQVRSASSNIIATGLTVSDTVGALPIENSNLYVISTGELQANYEHNPDPAQVLRIYRERFATI